MITLSFRQQLDGLVMETRRREIELYKAVDAHIGVSILDGSAITGAPGQPWKTGRLYKSWKRKGSIAARLSYWTSNCPYADIIERNLRGAKLRSKIGGFHSVELTMLGFNRIVSYELDEIHAKAVVFKGGRWRDVSTGRFAKAPQ